MRTFVLVVALFAAGCVSTAGPLQPLTLGWERYFTVDWEQDQRNGAPLIRGRIVNAWGFPATNVRLLVDAVDASGAVMKQGVVWLGTEVNPGASARFEIPVTERGATYRVRVFSFDWIQTGGGDLS